MRPRPLSLAVSLCFLAPVTPAGGDAFPALEDERLARAADSVDCVVPTTPNPIEVFQPDGRRIRLRAAGGPGRLRFEDEAGRPVVRAGGRWVYARRERDGSLVATDRSVATLDPAAAGASVQLRAGAATRGTAGGAGAGFAPLGGREVQPDGNKEARGGGPVTAKNLVLLLRFADHGARTLPSVADVETIMNDPGGDPVLAPTGSVRDHYLESSYGSFTIDSTVVGWLDVPEDEPDYADGSSGLTPKIHDLITDGLDLADAIVDFSDYDEDGDGWVDAITFLHSGYGAEWTATDEDGTASTDRIWSHKWTIPTWTSAEGVKVGDYNISPGLWDVEGSDPGRIGVVAHELGHFFGLPDLYDTDGSSSGLGNWDLMASGSWGFDGSQQNPSHMSGWAKTRMGWLDPVRILPGAHSIRNLEDFPELLRVDCGYAPGEYLLIENRLATGFDAALPQSGLLVYHVDESKGSFGSNDPNTDEGYPGMGGWPSNNSHYRVALRQADGFYDMDSSPFNRGDDGDPFHGAATTALDNTTTPDTRSYRSGIVLSNGNAITGISAGGGTMTFTYSNPSRPAITTLALPLAREGEAYSFGLSHSGGSADWSEVRRGASYLQEDLGSSSFAAVGSAQGWQDDEEVWSLPLPFAFPYFERDYDRIEVSSNGFVNLIPCDPEPFHTTAYLSSSPRIAGLWQNLTTAGAEQTGEDVYVSSSASEVTVRWVAETVPVDVEPPEPVNFSITLRANGEIELHYGSGNDAIGPSVGLADGEGPDALVVASHDGAGNLEDANSILFTPVGRRLPPGMTLSAAGVLSGTPTRGGLFRPLLRATDSLHNYDEKELLLCVVPEGLHLDLSAHRSNH